MKKNNKINISISRFLLFFEKNKFTIFPSKSPWNLELKIALKNSMDFSCDARLYVFVHSILTLRNHVLHSNLYCMFNVHHPYHIRFNRHLALKRKWLQNKEINKNGQSYLTVSMHTACKRYACQQLKCKNQYICHPIMHRTFGIPYSQNILHTKICNKVDIDWAPFSSLLQFNVTFMCIVIIPSLDLLPFIYYSFVSLFTSMPIWLCVDCNRRLPVAILCGKNETQTKAAQNI